MPNQYSYGAVLAHYRNLGLISLSDELYNIYTGSSHLPNPSIAAKSRPNSQPSIAAQSRPNSVLSQPSSPRIPSGSPTKQAPGQRPTYNLTTKPSTEDRNAIVQTFLNELDNDTKHSEERQHSRGSDESSDQAQDPRYHRGEHWATWATGNSGIPPRKSHAAHTNNHANKLDGNSDIVEKPVPRYSNPKTQPPSHRQDWNDVQTARGNFSHSQSSLALSDLSSLDDYSLPVSGNIPAHEPRPAVPLKSSWREGRRTSMTIAGPSSYRNTSVDSNPAQRRYIDLQPQRRSMDAQRPERDTPSVQPSQRRSVDLKRPQPNVTNVQSSQRRPEDVQHQQRDVDDIQPPPRRSMDVQRLQLDTFDTQRSHSKSMDIQRSQRDTADMQPSYKGPVDSQRPQRISVKTQPPRSPSVEVPSPLRVSREVADVSTTADPWMSNGINMAASTANRKFHQRSRSSSRMRNQQKRSEDDSLPSISDSVSETGVEMVDDVALSSDYTNGVKIPEHEAATISRLPKPEPAMPAESIFPRQASPPPAVGSNETRKITPRPAVLDRSDTATTSRTQIYSPLAATFPPGSSYTDGPAFIPKPNVVRPGSLPESAIERAPGSVPNREQSIFGLPELYTPSNSHDSSLHSLSSTTSETDSMGMPSIQPALPVTSHNKHANPASQRLQAQPHHHFRSSVHTPSNQSHISAQSKTSSSSVAARLNSLPNTIAMPRFPEAYKPEDFEVRPVSAGGRSVSSSASGAYPPDIARYRDGRSAASGGLESGTAKTVVQGRRRGDSAVGGVDSSSSRSSGNSHKQEENVGKKLLRRLRGASLSGTK